jgi:hypothetical protein
MISIRFLGPLLSLQPVGLIFLEGDDDISNQYKIGHEGGASSSSSRIS